MYAAVAISSSEKSIHLSINLSSSYRQLKKFLKEGISDNSIIENIQEVELEGFNYEKIDCIIIQSTNVNKQGHLRFKHYIK